MVTLKEYAKNKGVSYEAVRKQVNRYKNELKGHISKVNRTQYLDEEATAFLDKKRAESPVIIVQTDDKERIEQLEREKEALLIKVAELQEKLIKKGEQVEQLQAANIALLEAKTEKKRWWQRRKDG